MEEGGGFLDTEIIINFSSPYWTLTYSLLRVTASRWFYEGTPCGSTSTDIFIAVGGNRGGTGTWESFRILTICSDTMRGTALATGSK